MENKSYDVVVRIPISAKDADPARELARSMLSGVEHKIIRVERSRAALELTSLARFWWDGGSQFFLSTGENDFLWSNPAYGGDNTIRPSKVTIDEFIRGREVRYMGAHNIESFCNSFREAFCEPKLQILDE